MRWHPLTLHLTHLGIARMLLLWMLLRLLLLLLHGIHWHSHSWTSGRVHRLLHPHVRTISHSQAGTHSLHRNGEIRPRQLVQEAARVAVEQAHHRLVCHGASFFGCHNILTAVWRQFELKAPERTTDCLKQWLLLTHGSSETRMKECWCPNQKCEQIQINNDPRFSTWKFEACLMSHRCMRFIIMINMTTPR